MKQTALEWLIEQMLINNYTSKQQIENAHWLINEAKEMEKQQTEISDEEIEEFAQNIIQPDDMIIFPDSFILGARWYREQIKKK